MADKSQISNLFSCSLCNGFLVDATAIVPCLHTYCKSCILEHSYKSTACPQCGSFFKREQEYLRNDYILQRLIYRLFPDHFKNEIASRIQFLKKQGIDLQSKHCKIVQVNIIVNFKFGVGRQNEESLLKLKNILIYLKCPAEIPIKSLKRFIRGRLQLDDKLKITMSCNACELYDDETISAVKLSFGDFSLNLKQPVIVTAEIKIDSIDYKRIVQSDQVTELSSEHRYPLRKRNFKKNGTHNKRCISTTTTTTTKESCSSLTWLTGITSSTDSSTDERSIANISTKESTVHESTPGSSEARNTSNEVSTISSKKHSSLASAKQKKSKPQGCRRKRLFIQTTTEIQTSSSIDASNEKLPDIVESLNSGKLKMRHHSFRQPRIIKVKSLAMSLSFPEAL